VEDLMSRQVNGSIRGHVVARNFLAAVLGVTIFSLSAAPQTASATPTADQIIDKYIAALGGRAAIQKQTTIASLGTIDVPAMHLSGTVMIHEKAPNKTLQVVIISGNVFRQACDGKAAWSDDPADGLRVLSGGELTEAQRDSDFYHALHFHDLYSKLAVTGTEQVDDRDAYVVEGTIAGETVPDKMYFDQKSGLVLRVLGHRHTADGEFEVQEDFRDYRSVDGVQLPFTILQRGGSSDFTIRISEIHHGADLPDSEFAQPKESQSKVQ
jgi:photosynthetic reaction center cytochrome c subunit